MRKHKKIVEEAKKDKHKAIIGLLLHLLWPGAGTIYSGEANKGVLQCIGSFIAYLLCFVIIGIPILIIIYIIAISTSLKGIEEYNETIELYS